MGICGKISKDQLQNCDYPLVGGVKDRLILINLEDWEDSTITVDPTNEQLITGIALPSGIEAYQYEGKNNSIEAKATLVKSKYSESYDHEVRLKMFYIDAAVKDEIEKLPKGKYVAIVENNFKGDDGKGAFEIYGRETGMTSLELNRELNNADTQGAYDILLKTSESKEGHLPSTLFNTDYATTKAIVDGLL
jgi:hypothetical protein